MPQVPTPRTSSFLFALTQEIEKKLRRALTSPSQRRNLLQKLFADIALEVDDRARDILLGRQDLITLFEDGTKGPLCFYDVLADYFVWEPGNGNPILDLIVQLWSQSFVSNIFSLLFHKWLFEVQLEKSENLLRYSSALVQGATNVFWYGYLRIGFIHKIFVLGHGLAYNHNSISKLDSAHHSRGKERNWLHQQFKLD